MMRRVRRIADVRDAVRAARATSMEGGGTRVADENAAERAAPLVALVPTMGYLHEGHLALVDRARARADFVVMSVYVNPLQFGPAEDLAAYPRGLERDARLAADRGVDLLFAPSDAELYPAGDVAARVVPDPALAGRLCGTYRPGHFEGVLTVAAKLLNIVRPDVAVFGRKDYQQAVLIRRMAADLDFGVEIDVAPIVRERDGLAMSSRNTYLGDAERRSATALHHGLQAAAESFAGGETGAARLVDTARRVMEADGEVRIQYLELVHPETLEPVDDAATGSVLAVAAFVGRTRLIDNVVLG